MGLMKLKTRKAALLWCRSSLGSASERHTLLLATKCGSNALSSRNLLNSKGQPPSGMHNAPSPATAHLEIEKALNTGEVTSPRKNIMMHPIAPWPLSRQLQGGCRRAQMRSQVGGRLQTAADDAVHR